VQSLRSWLLTSPIILALALVIAAPRASHAEARLVIEADSGKVLEATNATVPWYPASLSKLMTAYVTLQAVKDGKITLDTMVTVSPLAASQSPSKMGFRPGTQLTVDNTLKMMLVKSANDMAVVLAEGVGGSIDGFSVMMNDTAKQLGMTQTSYVNPNGLPADGQITSARDMAILARAFIKNLPEYEYFVHIPSIRLGKRVTQNFNHLIGRYPGADGFKTGFICASGYNLVASATHDGRRLIAVVMGASSGTMRSVRAAQLLDRGFANNGLSWLKPSLGTVDQLVPVDTTPPDLHDEVCSGKHHRAPSDDDDAPVASAGAPSTAAGDGSNAMFMSSNLQAPMPKPSEWLSAPPAPSEPIVVYTGPTRTGAGLVAAVAADSANQDAAAPKHVKHGRRKPGAPAEPKAADAGNAAPEAKPATTAKPVARHAKPAATTAATDAAAPAAAKPAKPRAVAKPKPADAKPKSTSADVKPKPAT
jgi:D-alanyl-D-alanine carboxypeptidase